MSIDIQINPTAGVLSVSADLAEIIDEYAQDFDIRYCALMPDPALVGALRHFVPATGDERQAVNRMLAALEAGEGIELFVST